MNIFILDTSGIAHQLYHALKRDHGDRKNFMLYGVAKTILDIVEYYSPDAMVAALDGGRHYRAGICPDYKANRPPVDDELKRQLFLVPELLDDMGIVKIAAQGYEADDVIASFIRRANPKNKFTIVSSDKDLMQLVGVNVTQYSPIQNQMFGPREVEEKFGVSPTELTDYLAMVGDVADNIKGIKGVGPKAAVALLRDPKSVSPRINDLVKNSQAEFELAKKLVTLVSDLPIAVQPIFEMSCGAVYTNETAEVLMRKYGFDVLAEEVRERMTVF